MPAVHEAAGHIATIPGFGVLTSACLGHRFTRVPYSTSDAVVAAAGLDPRPDDSGLKEGRRRLSKHGPAEHRRLLFNCARSAAQRNPWRPYYEAQLAKGLSKTAATVVLARKMLRVAFAVYKRRQAFNSLLIGVGLDSDHRISPRPAAAELTYRCRSRYRCCGRSRVTRNTYTLVRQSSPKPRSCLCCLYG